MANVPSFVSGRLSIRRGLGTKVVSMVVYPGPTECGSKAAPECQEPMNGRVCDFRDFKLEFPKPIVKLVTIFIAIAQLAWLLKFFS